MGAERIHPSHPSFNAGLLEGSPERAAYAFVESGDLSVSDDGVVWRHRRKVGGNYPRLIDIEPVIAENLTPNGRSQVQVYVMGKRIVCLSSRLVWFSVNGEIERGHHIHHKNHDATDNRIENLSSVFGVQHITEHNQVNKEKWEHRRARERQRTWDLWRSGRTYGQVAEILGLTRVGVAIRLQRYRADNHIPGRNHKANLRKVQQDNGLLSPC